MDTQNCHCRKWQDNGPLGDVLVPPLKIARDGASVDCLDPVGLGLGVYGVSGAAATREYPPPLYYSNIA